MFKKLNLKILPENSNEVKTIKNDENDGPNYKQNPIIQNCSIIKSGERNEPVQSEEFNISETGVHVANTCVQESKKNSPTRVLKSIKAKLLSTFARQQSHINKINRKNSSNFSNENIQQASTSCVEVKDARKYEKIDKRHEVFVKNSVYNNETGHQSSLHQPSLLEGTSSNGDTEYSTGVSYSKPFCAETIQQNINSESVQVLTSASNECRTPIEHIVSLSKSAQLSSVPVIHPWISSFHCSNIGQHFEESCSNISSKVNHDLLLPNLSLDPKENVSRYIPAINEDFKIRQKRLENVLEVETLNMCENYNRKRHHFHEPHLQSFSSPHLEHLSPLDVSMMSPKCDIFQGNLYDQAYNSTQSPALSELLQNNSCVETVAKVRKDPIGAHCGSLPSSDERVPTKSWSQEFRDFSKQSWYWGPLTRHEAEEKLTDCSDGVFLVRDSSDDRYLLSLSFRSFGKTYHTRIDHSNGLFSFNPPREHKGFATLNELITSCVAQSSSGVLCYSKARNSASPGFPVRLCTPLSRTTQVQPLQHLCCFVILQHTRLDLVPRLPLPPSLTRLLAHKHR